LREKLLAGADEFPSKVISSTGVSNITLYCKGLSEDEKLILTEGCLMNYYAAGYGR
jgi:aconitate hydratase